MLLGTLGAGLLENILAGKETNRAGEEVIRAAHRSKRQELKKRNGFLMPPLPLPNFEIQKYYQYEPRFNGVYSRDNLPKSSSAEIKEGYSDIGTHWVALCIQNNDVIYFDYFDLLILCLQERH